MIGMTLALILAALALAPATAAANVDPRPKWIWSISETESGGRDRVVLSDIQRGGRLAERHDFGPAAFDFLRPPGRATAEINGTANGVTYDVVAQYSADGVFDDDFGLVMTDLSNRVAGDDFAEDLALEADGGIVVVGRNTSDTFNDLAIVRYDEAGAVDADPLLVDFHGGGDVGQDVAIDGEGRIVAAGHAINGFATEFALLRALP